MKLVCVKVLLLPEKQCLYVQLSEEMELRFMAAVKRMKQAFNLCSSSDKLTDYDKDCIHFYCAVRSVLFKMTKGDAPDIAQMNARVREMLEGTIQFDGIEELFETGKHISVDIFSEVTLSVNTFDFIKAKGDGSAFWRNRERVDKPILRKISF